MQTATDDAERDNSCLAVDQYWMKQALFQAEKAMHCEEVPIGAVVVYEGKMIAHHHNSAIRRRDPTAHAEILALRSAARRLGNYRLKGAILYVTIEPCLMCLGALLHARVDTLVFACAEPRSGAVISRAAPSLTKLPYRRLDYRHGVLAAPARALLQQFFYARRPQNSQIKDAVLAEDVRFSETNRSIAPRKATITHCC